jgi:hypothetical protein
MRSIIRQNANQPVLPDFRNVGTILRILIAVNAGAALYAFARDGSPAAMSAELTLATAVVEPYLLQPPLLVSPGSRSYRSPRCGHRCARDDGRRHPPAILPARAEPLAMLLLAPWALFAIGASRSISVCAHALSPARPKRACRRCRHASARISCQQHQCGAVAGPQRPQRGTALQDSGPVPRADATTAISRRSPTRRKPAIPRARTAAWETGFSRMEREEHARDTPKPLILQPLRERRISRSSLRAHRARCRSICS